jgi:hypothetical protein
MSSYFTPDLHTKIKELRNLSQHTGLCTIRFPAAIILPLHAVEFVLLDYHSAISAAQ